MTPNEFEALGRLIHGERSGWQKALAEKLQIHARTVNRYANGKAAIPLVVQLAVRQLAGEKS